MVFLMVIFLNLSTIKNLICSNDQFVRNMKILYSLTVFYFFFSIVSCNMTRNAGNELSDFLINDFEVDKLGNYYLINYEGDIRKFSADKTFLYSFKNSSYGNIASLDVSNPHKILVFYKEFQTILILDNTLNDISTIKLDYSQYYSAAGTSNDGNIWLYNSLKNQLSKISFNGMIIEEFNPLNAPYPGSNTDSKIFDRENRLFITDDISGIFSFNNFGYLEKIIPVTNIRKPEFSKNTFYYFEPDLDQIQQYQMTYNQKTLIKELNSLNPEIAVLKNGKIYLLHDNILIIMD